MAKLTMDQALQKGIEAHKAGQVQEADRLYTAILKAQPKHPDANHNMGVLAVGVGKVEQALPFFKTALEANPATAQFWLSYIDALIKLNKLGDAKAVLDQAKSKGAKGDGFDKLEQRLKDASEEPVIAKKITAEAQPKHPNILDTLKLDQALNLAKKKAKEGSLDYAKRIYQDILVKFPKNKRAVDGLKGLVGLLVGADQVSKVQDPLQGRQQAIINLYNQGHFKEALQQISILLQQFPNSSFLFNISGAAYKGLCQLDASVEAYKKAISIKPDFAEAYYNMGNTLKEQGKLDEAIEVYTNAFTIKPDYAEAYNNMGNALKEQGKPEKAIKSYKKALAIKPDYADANFNIGSVLEAEGQLEEAVEAYNKVLAIKPDFAEAYYNMGIALKGQGKLEDAIEAYNKALAIKPDYAEAYYNMGNALKEQGKVEEAIEAYSTGTSLKPDYSKAYYNMGVILQNQGKSGEAIEAYKKALFIKPDYDEAYYNMRIALQGIIFDRPDRELQKTIVSLLDRKTYARPSDIASAAISLLKFEPSLQKCLQLADNEVIESPTDIISELSELSLLVKLMSICPLPNLSLENLFSKLRSSLLLSLPDITSSPELLSFQSALALQCFTNEYIYNSTEEEEKAIRALAKIVKKSLDKKKQPSPQIVLALASYKSLNQFEWSNSLLVNDGIEDVFTRQVVEPNQEEKLKSVLPLLDDITDEVSSKVRDQYEESPYPRWVNLGLSLKPMSISKTVDEVKLKLHDDKISEVEKPEILIAGCGTGQHSIGTASRFKDSKVLAIDLSLSSISYAKRKTEELGIQNINYMQADILDLGKLSRRFDIVESAGVVHHMDDPVAGWRVLTDCLIPGGLMKIGLYSELARQHIVEMRQEISKAGIGSSDAAMKSFRTMVMTSDRKHHKKILVSSDFYSLSELRDLLFHVQEHRFTIPQIQDCLSELGLKFCGFESAKIVSHFKLANTGVDDPYDLEKWQAYEEANPNAFAGMYQFWCQKVA